MSDEPIHSGEFTIKWDENLSKAIYDQIVWGTPQITYALTAEIHFYRVRRRLARIMPLMRRPRGRKLLRAQSITEKMDFYNVVLEESLEFP